MLLRPVRTISAIALAFAFGCTTGDIADPTTTPPPGDTTPPDDNTPPPQPQPEALSSQEVQTAVNAAVAGSFGDAQTGVELARSGNLVTLTGAFDGTGGVVTFTGFQLNKAPFSASGRVTFSSRDQEAVMEFAGSTVASYSIDGVEIGSIELSMPAVDEFVDTTVGFLLGLALDCQGGGLDIQQGQVVLSQSCTAVDQNGVEIGSLVVDDVTIDLANQAVSGSVELTAAGVVLELVFDGQNVTVVVNGNEVANVTVADLVQLLL